MIVAICGPTAAGKTAAALVVAEELGAVIVSADAMQVYRGMDIGTAKATPEERARVPHFGIDLVNPDQPFDAADFVALAERVIADHEHVVVAGGTSLYVRSLIRGLVSTPAVDPALRAQLAALPDPHAALAAVDPALAARLHPHDTNRIVRGLEVFEASGQRLSELQDAHAREPDRHVVRGLWLDRSDLFARIDARVEAMIASGYVDEVRGLLAAGYSRDLKPMKSLGYRHLADHVVDGLDLGEAVRRTKRDTRQFARKQRNWMRSLGFERVIDGSVDDVARSAIDSRR
jgi:tRNA dimethylallyltransferase